VLFEFRGEIGNPSIEATAHFLHYSAGFGRDVKQAISTLNTMIDSGSKYKQLEGFLGAGVCFVLPTNIGETNWTKILTKSTDRNRSVMRSLSETEIPALAVKYACLRERIVGAKLTELWALQQAGPSQFIAAPSQELSVGVDLLEQLPWADVTTEPDLGYSQAGQ